MCRVARAVLKGPSGLHFEQRGLGTHAKERSEPVFSRSHRGGYAVREALYERVRRLNLASHVRQLETDNLVVLQLLPKCLALPRPRYGFGEAHASKPVRLDGEPEPLGHKITEQDAGVPDEVGLGDADLVELDVCGARAVDPHALERPHAHPWPRPLNQQERHSRHPRVLATRPDRCREEVRKHAARDPLLEARHDEEIAVLNRRRLEVGDVRSTVGLAHRKRDTLLPEQTRPCHALLELRSTKEDDGR
mmetsp:Transcript_36528/g.82728  ORF Transcript_36528/g.82728 Transcript_36528/m.82728 type:complete len:249 (-) Transcript_36528:122-868(-)